MMFERYCMAAYDSIKNALLSDCIICNDMPSYLHTSLVTEAKTSTAIMLQNMKSSLAKSVCQLPNTPAISELIIVQQKKTITLGTKCAEIAKSVRQIFFRMYYSIKFNNQNNRTSH